MGFPAHQTPEATPFVLENWAAGKFGFADSLNLKGFSTCKYL